MLNNFMITGIVESFDYDAKLLHVLINKGTEDESRIPILTENIPYPNDFEKNKFVIISGYLAPSIIYSKVIAIAKQIVIKSNAWEE